VSNGVRTFDWGRHKGGNDPVANSPVRPTLAAEESFPWEVSPAGGNFWTYRSRLFPGQVTTRGGSFPVAIWQQGVRRREIN
jgi:hypothetical protein